MIDKTTRRRRSLTAALGIAAICVPGVLAATAAQAAPQPGNIDPDATTSITVHKHERTQGTTPGVPDGSVSPNTPTIDGVTFEVYPVGGIDLAESSDWDKLANLGSLTSCELPAPLTKGPAVDTVVTANGGIATFAQLKVGAYLVCETAAPATVVDRAKPFVVTTPTTLDGGWVYDVHAYPKNGVSGIEKTVQTPDELGLGATVRFTVTTDIPTMAAADSLTSYIVSDTLDQRLGATQVESVEVDGVAVPAEHYSVERDGARIDVVFTPSGLAWLKPLGGHKVTTVFSGVVQGVGNGEISNEATAYVNDPDRTNGITSDPVQTSWGNVRLQKVNAAHVDTGLQGAEFEVYNSTTPYAPDCSTATPTGNRIEVNGGGVFTSNTAGALVIDGLFVSDSTTGDQAARCYVLKETKAPAGFVTPAGDSALTPITVKKGETTGYDVTISNQQRVVPELPLTGSTGQAIMIAGGIALIAVGTALYAVRRKARSNRAS